MRKRRNGDEHAATDVAREASEMILADDNFATIIDAVREGRVVWDNLRKVLLINTPINNAQGLSVLFGIMCGLEETPLTPIQVLYFPERSGPAM